MSKRHRNREGDLESLFLRLEELVLANSGEDEFEEVFKLVVAKLLDERSGGSARFRRWPSEAETFEAVSALLREAEKAWPGILGTETRPRLLPEHLQARVEALARHSIGGNGLQAFDECFEFLVSRSAKGAKGQFFTPRHVVELCVRIARPARDEIVCDPGCGSGGFLFHALDHVRDREGLSPEAARRYRGENLWGFDIDDRAIRVAKALMLLAGGDKANFFRLNSLLQPGMGGLFPEREAWDESGDALTIKDACRSRRGGFDVSLTNPPFAGEVRERHVLDHYETSRGRARIERDVLFVERCVDLLRPGGRLGIVLPHNKFSAAAFASARRRLLREARIRGVIGLGRSTFLPHTHQKACVLFAQRRTRNVRDVREAADERIFFAVSEKTGKDSKGRLVLRDGAAAGARAWEAANHDFEKIVDAYHRFANDEPGWSGGPAPRGAKTARELGRDLVLVPERHDPRRTSLAGSGAGTLLGDVAEILRATASPKEADDGARFLVVDTSDAREGVLACRKEPVALAGLGSTKKVVEQGCVLVSRLRPYLRQVALADGGMPGWAGDVRVPCSTEFFVLRSPNDRSIAFLVPFLLLGPVQAVLAASQEGGHHPRFGRDALLGLPVPASLVERRDDHSAKVEEAVAMFRRYERLTGGLVEDAAGAFEKPRAA